MLNPIALWKALRHFSLTFAVIFASTLLGASATALLSKVVGHLPLPWIVLWILPMIIVAMVAKREARWLPDEALRRRIAKRIVYGAVIIWFGLFALRLALGPEKQLPPAPPPDQTPSAPGQPIHRGPPGR